MLASSSRSGVQSAFDLLILRLAVQEEAGLQKPPTIRSAARADAMLQRAAGGWGTDAAPVRPWRLRLVYLRLVLGLRHLTGTLWSAPLAAWRAARERTHGHTARLREVTSYATSSPRESQVLRISILLRLMGQRAASARTLVRRVQSGRSSPWCTHLLALLLAETGQVTASPALAGVGPMKAASTASRRVQRSSLSVENQVLARCLYRSSSASFIPSPRKPRSARAPLPEPSRRPPRH